jgi:hypothetical protein
MSLPPKATKTFFEWASVHETMSGIVFFGSEQYESVASFYTKQVGADVWLDQSACTILQYDTLLFGFCQADAAETDGVLTFVTDDRAGVDEFYDRFENRARGEPAVNEEYDIYQFFAADPEGRTMEFQTFVHDVDPVC